MGDKRKQLLFFHPIPVAPNLKCQDRRFAHQGTIICRPTTSKRF
jgi:hypothetical protein